MKYRDFNIEVDSKCPNLFIIQFDGAGRPAAALSGQYTSPNECKKQIDLYLNGDLKKGKPNGKAETQG